MAPSPFFDDLRGDIDAALRDFLEERSAALPEALPLISEIAGLIEAGGKRLRPLFCYWGYRAAGGTHGAPIVRAAAALELLHTFALVHDDIIDGSTERRGRPTVHVTRGADVALLVGDLALVLADAALLTSGFEQDVLLAALVAYSRMRQEVISGQYLDVASVSEPISEEQARRIAVLKSGNYTSEEPLLIGATLAGAPETVLAALSRFGRPLGEAFQLRDDLLGTFGDRAVVGKPTDSDIREGKRNLLFAKTVAALTGEEHDFFTSRWGAASLTSQEVDRLRGLVDSCGARAATEALLQELATAARAALGEIDLDDASRDALTELLETAVGRDA